jgi:hypothetical protein
MVYPVERVRIRETREVTEVGTAEPSGRARATGHEGLRVCRLIQPGRAAELCHSSFSVRPGANRRDWFHVVECSG